ncbi:WD40-repeat-containing domain protein [Syncephalis plumigaleata]|nr:WD40-repeat-containing domain protein [Syncephalis plumigaleata]
MRPLNEQQQNTPPIQVNSKQSQRGGGMDVVARDWTPVSSTSPSKKTTTIQSQPQSDRFIPNRQAMNISASQFNVALKEQQLHRQRMEQGDDSSSIILDNETTSVGLMNNGDMSGGSSAHTHSTTQYNANTNTNHNNGSNHTACEDSYAEEIARAYGVTLNERILSFGAGPPSQERSDLRALANKSQDTFGASSSSSSGALSAQQRRHIPMEPERKLDAPGIINDYYLNLLDWSFHNVLAIGLDKSAYLWNTEDGKVEPLLETEGTNVITSVKFSNDGDIVAVGVNDGTIHLVDAVTCKRLRVMKDIVHVWAHWHGMATRWHPVAELQSHTSDVCGLGWRNDGQMLASGGNDNIVNMWDIRSLSAPHYTKTTHIAAVKAVSWCPWQNNLLATGGGTGDRNIHIWNSNNGALLSSMHTTSQVAGLFWSPHAKELISAHGHPDNQLTIWTYPSLMRVIDIPAHESRILYSTLSPDGRMLATAASDESLKIWRVLDETVKATKIKIPSEKKSKNYKGIRVR